MPKHRLRQPSLPGVQRSTSQLPEIIRHEQIERQWRLLVRLLNTRYGLTLAQLADCAAELGATAVSDRTIRRDIDALTASGFQIESRRTESGVCWFLVDADTVSRLAKRHVVDDEDDWERADAAFSQEGRQ